ncbi:tagaturonate reductase [Paenibacillus macerans]|uniref:tagaturonate reductase n=1 Tax=Paenibacillus macerans TaxID=44252 RepID=UPI0022E0D244|nr:tagaturonate reductase [Paenibacillus macerans]MEC0140186.1 tagaturonate reductase [Paenibacillus macerans]
MARLLSRTMYPDLPIYPERVIQFGEGNFMRAFAAWQLQRMNKQGLFQGSVVMVKPRNGPVSEDFEKQDCLYTVAIDGIAGQKTVREREIITSVSRLISPYSDYEGFLALAEDDNLEFITSNTTESGIAYNPADTLNDRPPSSFPGKLTALLYRRFRLGKKGFVILPCELIDRNGERLREIVLRYAADWRLGEPFATWLNRENTFCCTLVDRIVAGFPQEQANELERELGYQDRLMVASEPYLLWVIEGPSWLPARLPLAQAGLDVIFTKDLKPYREQKVHLLNGPHTAMASLGLLAGLQTVEEVMKDADFSAFVRRLMDDELLPVLHLPKPELQAYARAVRERFMNPFVRHELASIYLNSISKFTTRLLPVLLRHVQENRKLPGLLTLSFAALLLGYRGDRLKRKDSPEVLAVFDEAWQTPDPNLFIRTILKSEVLWGLDLSDIPQLAEALKDDLMQLDQMGCRAVLRQRLGGEITCND